MKIVDPIPTRLLKTFENTWCFEYIAVNNSPIKFSLLSPKTRIMF